MSTPAVARRKTSTLEPRVGQLEFISDRQQDEIHKLQKDNVDMKAMRRELREMAKSQKAVLGIFITLGQMAEQALSAARD